MLCGVGIALWVLGDIGWRLLAHARREYTPVSTAPAPSASAGGIRPQLLQLMTPARQTQLAAFDLDHKRALEERDAAIDRCEKKGGVVAMGFGMSVVCIRNGTAVETKIAYPEYPVFDP